MALAHFSVIFKKAKRRWCCCGRGVGSTSSVPVPLGLSGENPFSWPLLVLSCHRSQAHNKWGFVFFSRFAGGGGRGRGSGWNRSTAPEPRRMESNCGSGGGGGCVQDGETDTQRGRLRKSHLNYSFLTWSKSFLLSIFKKIWLRSNKCPLSCEGQWRPDNEGKNPDSGAQRFAAHLCLRALDAEKETGWT